MKSEEVKEVVKKGYSKIAGSGCCGSGCACDSGKKNEEISRSIGYSDEEIVSFSEANLGLGCGNPVAMAAIREGDVVLDLGSGAGFDAFIARGRVGMSGRVIGVDMTKEMVEKARGIAAKLGFSTANGSTSSNTSVPSEDPRRAGNVEFRLGDIEDLPVESESIDVVISNCVINLAPDKEKVFREAWRVLKKGGAMFVSDIVLLSELDGEKRKDERLLCGCVGGALLKDDYIEIARSAGFDVEVLGEDKKISKEQYKGVDLESLKLKLMKGCCCGS